MIGMGCADGYVDGTIANCGRYWSLKGDTRLEVHYTRRYFTYEVLKPEWKAYPTW